MIIILYVFNIKLNLYVKKSFYRLRLQVQLVFTFILYFWNMIFNKNNHWEFVFWKVGFTY